MPWSCSRVSAVVAAILVACASAVAEEADSPHDALQSAVQRGRDLVIRAGTNWRKHKSCFSCHHQTLTMLTVVESSRFGFPADDEWMQLQARHTHAYFQDQLEVMLAGDHVPGGASSAGYGLWAMKLARQPPDEITTAMVGYLLKIQGVVRHSDRDPAKPPRLKDGAWLPSCRRPPLQGSDIATTVLSLVGMEHYASEEQRSQLATARTAADRWLAETPLTTQDDRAWRLWGLSQLGGDASEIERIRAAILQAQRNDGGWAETDDRQSDAYSTGEILFILCQTGTPLSDPVLLRGRDYLLKTQLEDGSWLVETHVKPVQTFFENGDPHGKHQFLSTSATAWSTAALTQLLPIPQKSGSPAP